jgi:hypothetical protein
VAVRVQPYSDVCDLHLVCCSMTEGTEVREVCGNRRGQIGTGRGVRKTAWIRYVVPRRSVSWWTLTRMT